MNSNGDYAGKFIGVGSESSPSLAVGSEPSTGIYLETPGAASGLNFTKRGTKRLRIDDSGSTFYGPVNCGTGSSFSTITLSDGSQALPSLNFTGATTSGLSLDTSGTSTHLHTSISGVSKIRVQDDFINTNVPFHLPTGSTTQPALTFSSSSSCGLSFDTQGTSSHVHTSVAGISRTRVSEDLFYLTVPIEAGTNAISGGPMDCSSLTSTGTILAPSDAGTVSIGMFGAPTKGIIFDAPGEDIVFAPSGVPTIGFYSDGSANFEGDIEVHNGITDDSLTASQLVQTDSKKKLTSTGLSLIDFMKTSLFFGNGSDGSVTLTGGTTTLTKDMYYTTLTLNSSAIIKTNGCRIFASVAINGDGTGIIHFNGNDASGQTAGSAVVFGSPMPGNSSAGGSGGAINTNGSISTNTAGCAGGRGGHGGDSDTKTGASSGTIPFSITYVYQNPLLANTYFNGPGGSGGGGGAGQSTTNVGGGGGASGGIVWIAAKSFGGILALQANGGNGGNSTGSAGVGAGGGGGFVYLLYETLTGGWNPATQISVAGGTNGTGGNTTNSTNSSVGNYVCYQLT